MVLDMTQYHEQFKKTLKRMVEENKEYMPTLHIITDGKDERCKVYVKSKLNMCKELGINCVIDTVTTQEEMFNLCEEIWSNYGVSICQLPISKELEEVYKLEAEGIDVDGMFSFNDIFNKNYHTAPATARGVFMYLKDKYRSLRGKNIVLVGMGDLCNKPLLVMLANEGATIMTFNTSTEESVKLNMLKNADIVICAGGKKGTVKTSQLPDTKEVLVFNVGTVFDNKGRLDTELEVDVEKDNVIYTPRIKGVGVMTVMNLMYSVCCRAERSKIDNEVKEVKEF